MSGRRKAARKRGRAIVARAGEHLQHLAGQPRYCGLALAAWSSGYRRSKSCLLANVRTVDDCREPLDENGVCPCGRRRDVSK